jgi:hypothetical protein
VVEAAYPLAAAEVGWAQSVSPIMG